jgi:hypothetical protein
MSDMTLPEALAEIERLWIRNYELERYIVKLDALLALYCDTADASPEFRAAYGSEHNAIATWSIQAASNHA